jgi:hypothetical protein
VRALRSVLQYLDCKASRRDPAIDRQPFLTVWTYNQSLMVAVRRP